MRATTAVLVDGNVCYVLSTVVTVIILLLYDNVNLIASDKLRTIHNIICFLLYGIVRMEWRIHTIGFAINRLCSVFPSS